jgi:nitrogen regulatory protein PII
MKLIVAIVRPFKLDEIITELEELENFPGMTVVDSEGFGQRIRTTPTDALDPLKPNKRIEIACSAEMVEPIATAIKRCAHTGRKGDGFVMVLNIEESGVI